MKAPFQHEPGWYGAFTRNQEPGALPNGTRVVKTNSDASDRNSNGALGTVLGSLAHRDVMDGEPCYFIEWDSRPRAAVVVRGCKVQQA